MSSINRFIPLEAVVWLTALVGLALIQAESTHVPICPLALAEVDWCPGCGLGRSINYLFHLEFEKSLSTHPLGIFAVIILSYRIIQLIKIHFKTYGKSN